ncbi:MAG TPA: DNA adenine methylase [Flavobacterium sp.]|jgi:DNA adenine methylase|nr:DNA adenine methylase [Paludibacteraceae bacterium]OQC34686.1 MAG: Modification methylase DpnIIA [Bacteroidetes bacterium ADurb.Bin057]HHT61346.1 DNA adenine methylase [Bacteroidales bacterium]HPW99045.1 DNA adenine methylase [Flavobacterium sp.]MBP9039023.1 DNA adenine methylase [Paludibacteraceae bacterium]
MKNSVKEPIATYNQIGLDFGNYVESRKLYPILKWAGGKEQELKYIVPNLPEKFKNYYEPFVGGGAVYTALQADKYFVNDKSEELISLYRSIINSDRTLFFKALDEIIHNWDLLTLVVKKNDVFFVETYKKYSSNKIEETKLKDILFEFILKHADQFNGMFSSMFNFNIENFIKEIKINLIRKIKRMKQLEKEKYLLPDNDILDNIETALKSAFYMHFRHIYNNTEKYKINSAFKSAIFLFIRNFAYSGMFRYNSKGDFNVPYGGIAYNNKNFSKKVEYLKTKELKSLLDNTVIENLDFEDFFKQHTPENNDFVFLDPPYDSEFSTYAKNEFTKKDQIRLANYLIKKCKGKWMMIIKNTDFIFELYKNKGLNIQSFDKKYLVSFMNRNDKNVEHLLITNY